VHPDDRAGLQQALTGLLQSQVIHHRFRLTPLLGTGSAKVGLTAQLRQGRIEGAIVERMVSPSALDRFVQATNASPEAIFLLDFDTGHHFWSDKFTARYGHAPLTGPDVVDEWFALVHPEEQPRIKASHSAAREGQADYWQDEYRLRRADGGYANVIDRAHFFRRPDGSVARSISSLQDVTDLRNREEELRLATEASRDVIYVWDVAQNSLQFNPGLARQFGLDPAPFLADVGQWMQLIDPADRPRVETQLREAMRSSATRLEMSYRINRPGLAPVQVIDRMRLSRDATGQLQRAVGSIVDEAHLRREEQRLRAVVGVAAHVIYEMDPESGIIEYSDGGPDVAGHPWVGQILAGNSWIDLLHPDDREAAVARFHSFLDGSERSTQIEYRLRRADGNWAHVHDRIIALRDAQGRATRVIGGMEDVTAALQAEEKLRQTYKLEAIGKLTGGVAHDFNNLLTVILGNAGLLEGEADLAPEHRAIARTIGAAARRGAELTASLLAFARRQPLAPRSLDMAAIIEELASLLKRTLPATIELKTLVPKGLWVVEADPAQLNAALLNMAVNAADAMPAGGRIVLEATNAMLDEDYVAAAPEVSPGEYLRIDMTDNGTGMAPDVVARAFDPFFTTKPLGKGSGLGLSMVYGFAKQSDGHVKIYSELGQGTKISLYLPKGSQGASPEVVERPAEGIVLGRQQHVLVVEDDPMLRKFVVAMTERLNYRVTDAEHGEAALLALRANPDICLLFTDVVMPGSMNGKDLADRARADFPHLRVLFTSGYTENSIVHHGRLDEGVHFLAKPYQLRDLGRKLAEVLVGVG
jgi:PAS domain S-box-containing protein